MLIPIGHEKSSARRVPIITISLIAINLVVFAITNSTFEEEAARLGTMRAHILILAAEAPELQLPPEAQKVVNIFQQHHAKDWQALQNQNRDVIDGFDARVRLMADDPAALQKEMDSLNSDYVSASTSSISEHYAFIPSHPSALSYITANFLHGGWLHLIGNMWFLWLAGFVLEDVWGRALYTVFYFVAGAVALQIYAMTNAGSQAPAIGASGAVAALMGAFLVRFPKMKIKLVWLIALRVLRFQAAAYWLLPLWLVMEVFYGSMLGNSSGVAHWAHVGGFVFGAIVGVALGYSGLEHTVSKTMDKKIGITDREIRQASELLEHGKLDEARTILNTLLAKKPDSIDALGMLREIQRRRSEDSGYLETTAKLCAACLKERSYEAAWHEYQDFLQAGGTKLPAPIWLNLCRGLEEQQNFDAALSEYNKLIAAYPTERQSLMAQLQAAGVCLKRLNRPQEALKFYQAAASSPIPHLDLDATIQLGIKSATMALSSSKASSATSGA